jgi:hypothetical protein
MNGFLVLSMEGGFLLCSRSYKGADFGLGATGSNHLQLSSTLFTFWHMAMNAIEKEGARLEELHDSTDASSKLFFGGTGAGAASKAMDLTGRLHWLKFGGVFLHFQEIPISLSSSTENEPASTHGEDQIADGGTSDTEMTDKGTVCTRTQPEEKESDVVLVVLISDGSGTSLDSGENVVIEPLIAGVQRRLRQELTRKSDSSTEPNISEIWKVLIHQIIQEEMPKYQQLLSTVITGTEATTTVELLQEKFFRNLCQEHDAAEESQQSWFETLSQIPMRLIRALAQKKRDVFIDNKIL